MNKKDPMSGHDLIVIGALAGDQAKQRYLSPGMWTLLHLGLGEKDKALDWLEKCYEDQDVLCLLLKVWQIYDPLRTEPRFQALLKKVGLDK